MEELQAAIQIVKIPFEFGEVVLRMGMDGARTAGSALTNGARFAWEIRREILRQREAAERAMIDSLHGEMSHEELLQKTGGDLMVMHIDEKQLDTIKGILGEYKIDYAVANDTDLNDGKRAVFFPTAQVQRMNSLNERLMVDGIRIDIKTPIAYEDEKTDAQKEKLDQEMAAHAEKTYSGMSLEDAAKLSPDEQRIFIQLRAEENQTETIFTFDKKLLIGQDQETMTFRLPQSDDRITFRRSECLAYGNDQTYVAFKPKDEKMSVQLASGKTEILPAQDVFRRFRLNNDMLRRQVKERKQAKTHKAERPDPAR